MTVLLPPVNDSGVQKEGPYQDRPLLYPFHHNPSLLGSCSSPGSACSCPILHSFPQEKGKKAPSHKPLQYPTPKYNQNPVNPH